MRTIYFVFIVFLFAALFHFACRDEIAPPETESDPGILLTDEFGNILGGDSTDWCWRGASNGFSFGPAYPNPAIGPAFTIRFYSSGGDTVKMYFLRSAGDTIFVVNDTTSAPGNYAYSIDVSAYNFTNSYRRLYINTYSYSASDSCRNYGDIKFEE